MQLKTKLKLVVWFHHVVIVSLLISGVLCTMFEPFYVSVPIVAFILALGTDLNQSCILTRRENRFRRQLGLPEIDGFVKHYYLRRRS